MSGNNQMNYSEALSFVFEDEEWLKKMAIGGFIALVSFYAGLVFIFGFFLVGYYIGVMRLVMAGDENPLPDWSDTSKLFVDGLLGAIISLVYVIICGGLCALFIVNLANSPYTSDAEMVVGCVVAGFATFFALTFFINYGLMQFALTESFSAAFSFPDMLRFFRNNLGDFIAITIFSLILNLMLLCAGLAILSPFTNFWGMVVQAHLFGQCARQSRPVSEVMQTASPAL